MDAPTVSARALVLPIVGVALIAALVLGAGPSTAGKPKPPSWALHGSYSPMIDSANFVAAVDNRYFPLKPGMGFHYKGVKGKTPQIDDMVVTRQTIRILGVTCTVVRDTVSQHGEPARANVRLVRTGQAGQCLVHGGGRPRTPEQPICPRK